MRPRLVGGHLESFGFHPQRSGRDHLRVLCRAIGADPRRPEQLLRKVGLEADAGRPAGVYSTGMRQRLAIACALVAAVEVLVLDEPATGLDPLGIRWLRGLLREHADAGGIVVISSHALAEVELIADRVVIMNGGRTLLCAPTHELTGAGATVRTPHRDRLVNALAAEGADVTRRPGDDRLVVHGVGAPRVGEVAAGAGVVLHELGPLQSLEDIYARVTGDPS